jgi:hypothetical protein
MKRWRLASAGLTMWTLARPPQRLHARLKVEAVMGEFG